MKYALPLALLVMLGGWRLRTAAGVFDSWVWQATTEHRPGGPRSAMVEDLIRRHLKPGMNRRVVLSMLGEADDDVDGDWFYTVYKGETPQIKYYAQYYAVNLMVAFKGDLLKEARVIHPPVVYTEARPHKGGIGFLSIE